MEEHRGRLGPTIDEIRRLTGREWLLVSPEDGYQGPGAYVHISDHGRGESIYPGKGARVLERLADEAWWSEDADELGYEAFSRCVTRYAAVAFYTRTATEDEARDVEALVFWATVHLTGHPPLVSGGAWLPRTARGKAAWEIALGWVRQELSGGESGGQAA